MSCWSTTLPGLVLGDGRGPTHQSEVVIEFSCSLGARGVPAGTLKGISWGISSFQPNPRSPPEPVTPVSYNPQQDHEPRLVTLRLQAKGC